MIINKKIQFFHLSISNILGIFILISTCFFIIVFPSHFNPDYYSYKKIFLRDINLKGLNIYFFSFLSHFFKIFCNYKTFRSFLALFQIISYFFIFKKLNLKIKNLNLYFGLLLSSFLILKVHIQIRESLAILIWFYLLSYYGINKNFSIKENFICFLSIFMHSSSLILWIPTLIYKSQNYLNNNKRLFIYLFFILIGIFSCSTFIRIHFTPLVNNQILNARENFQNYLNYYSIELSLKKIIYWCFYIITFFCIYFEENIIHLKFLEKDPNLRIPYFFRFISLNGSLVYLSTVLIYGFIFEINKLDYNLIFRTEFMLLFLLSLYRNIIHPNKKFTLVLNFLIAFDIIRMIFINGNL